jgi:putative peptide zinc metalloprotease protein
MIGLTLSMLLIAAMQEAFSTLILFSTSTYWILCLLAFSTLWHELGHIQAAKEYGLNRISIGAGIYFFFPVLFTDMTSAYLLERPKRLVIGLAGIYFEWIYALLLLVCFQILGAQVFAQAGLVVLIKSLYNLNPFFKTDGYWVLSDFLQIHQLRDSAYKCLGRFLVGKNALLKNERTLWVYALAHMTFYAVFTIFLTQRLTVHLQHFFSLNLYEVDAVKIGGLLAMELLAFFHLFKLLLQAIYSLPEYLAAVTKN